ncbi:hypothetical protein HPB50_010978 [Hyalomma asiaticum]|uniref:Uncharacterized protein n=1 Tax=Hyalomma asiaticum TaxID=266040 RepID=A0ACB7RNV0_HYAAI|nr:hypothetical protein HPB50_010978 [Hyalomma asiaticum]
MHGNKGQRIKEDETKKLVLQWFGPAVWEEHGAGDAGIAFCLADNGWYSFGRQTSPQRPEENRGVAVHQTNVVVIDSPRAKSVELCEPSEQHGDSRYPFCWRGIERQVGSYNIDGGLARFPANTW